MSENLLSDISFSSLELVPELLQGVSDAGFSSCTKIQAATLPLALAGHDVAGQAQTGTGKTAAYLVATFQHLLVHEPSPDRRANQPRAVILAPTRELAVQIHRDATVIGAHTGLRLGLVFGGTDYEKQQRLRYNVDTFDLGRMERLLKGVGNPHNKLEVVHIAGSKGKGSTATMLAKMLEANGYRVGLYTSPHVTTLHERIVVNSHMISNREIVRLVNRLHATIEKMIKKDDAPTFFEIMTSIAFLHFLDKDVDLVGTDDGQAPGDPLVTTDRNAGKGGFA